MRALPGASTFVFTDIEGSTQLLGELHTSYGLALRLQRQIIQGCFTEHEGTHMGSEGDGLSWRFATPSDAVAAALAAQDRLAGYGTADSFGLRVRMGIHCGPVRLSGGEYIGLTLHEVARICAAAHGDQVLCSAPVREAAADVDGVVFRELGSFMLRGIPVAHTLYQAGRPGDDRLFPPPREVFRAGGSRLTIWRREPARARPRHDSPAALALRAPDGGPLAPDVTVEMLPASAAVAGAFRLVVRRAGAIQEEYDGLTVGGPTDAARVLAAYSELVRVAPPGPMSP